MKELQNTRKIIRTKLDLIKFTKEYKKIMIKQLAAKDIKSYLMAESNSVLLDVRTKEEWETIGKPEGKKRMDIKSFLAGHNLIVGNKFT